MQINPDAQKIKRWREERCWSQEHLAEMAGTSARTVQRIERGDQASHETLMALAAAFNVDVVALTRDVEAEARYAAKRKREKGKDAVRLSFLIHLASFVLGMVVFAAISLGDGAPGYAMLAPSLWWLVGLAGHALVVALVYMLAHFQQRAEDRLT